MEFKRNGQALVEYVLVIGIAAVLSVSLTFFFNGVMSRGILKFNAVLESEVRTGGFTNPTPVGIWEN